MKKYRHIVVVLLCMLLTACGIDGPVDVPEGVEARICIAVSSDGLVTRTNVADPGTAPNANGEYDGKQHVTRVWLYIFEEDGADWTCVAAEDVSWPWFDGAVSGLTTREQPYTTIYQDYKDDKSYRFLAVGFDDTYTIADDKPVWNGKNSVEAYGAPADLIKINDKYSERCFALQSGKSFSLVAQSEPFAGAQTFTKNDLVSGAAGSVPIELRRRVAGVKGWFTGIPEKIGAVDVVAIELRLYTSQNVQVPFLPVLPAGYASPKSVPDNLWIDYITVAAGDAQANSSLLCRVERTSENAVLQAYALPILGSTEPNVSTLKVDLVDNAGNVLLSRKVLKAPGQTATRSGTGIIPDAGISGDNQLMHYPLRANQFYCMGSASVPIDMSGATGYIYIMLDEVWNEYYGGNMGDKEAPGIYIDREWGDHPGGEIDRD